MFKVLGVDHIGVAVADLKEVGAFWGDVLGLPANGEETVAEQKVTTGFSRRRTAVRLNCWLQRRSPLRLPNSLKK